jgi:hypothetical protein
MRLRTKLITGAVVLVLVVVGFIASQISSWAADALLHPTRRPVDLQLPPEAEEVTFAGAGVSLKGWRFSASGEKRGTIVYLHGVADNRAGVIGIASRFTPRGFDVITYDSRAHGSSGGENCTYGYYEKEDLRRVLDTIETGPVVLVGGSLGAAVALQTAAVDSRIRAIVAAETFSDLRSTVRDRAPFFFTENAIQRAFSLAEQRGKFQVDAVSPMIAAADITAAVLLIHGALDRETPPEHSQRVFDALQGPKRLILVEDAGHNESLSGSVWTDIEEWIDLALKPSTPLAADIDGYHETITVARQAGHDYRNVVQGCLARRAKSMHTFFRLSEHAGFDAAASQGHAGVSGDLLRELGDAFFGGCLAIEEPTVQNKVREDLLYDLGYGNTEITVREIKRKYPKTFPEGWTRNS